MNKAFLLLILFSLVTMTGLASYYVLIPLPLERLPFEFSLKQGSSLKSAAHQMNQAGVIQNDLIFVIMARVLGKAGQVKPGSYQLDSSTSPLQLLDIISKGKVTQSEISIIEGWTFRQFRAVMDASPTLRHDSTKLTETEILQRIGAIEKHAEGLFFPDTYNYASGSSDLVILKRAYQTMQRHLQECWNIRATDLPLSSPYEALILSSIVEKETGQAKDRDMIAAVFINRLRKRMRLQTDPTVIYGIGDKFDGNLRKRDLKSDTPFNTYTRDGLTPTPIALPGLASLQAAVNPAKSDALYFVARGDGTSKFSRSLTEHNDAVRRYQLK
jgi:UPF0755 protein